MKTALVTGASGFVGRHLCPLLREAGYHVTEIDIAHPDYPLSAEAFIERERRHGFTKWDVIVHLAANIDSIADREKAGVAAFQDIALDLCVFKYVEDNPPKECLVWPTSCAVDAVENDPYAFVKVAGEQFVKRLVKNGIVVKMLRPYSGYGFDQKPSYPFPAIVGRGLRRENPLTVWGSGHQVRDFIHIDDLARAFVHAIDHFPNGVAVPIGTAIPTSFLDFAKIVAEEVGYQPEIRGLSDKPESSPMRVADTSLAVQYGFSPRITLREGIRRAVREAQ